MPEQHGIQLTAGTVNDINLDTKSPDFAFHAGMALSSYTKKGNRWVFGGEYLEKRYPYKDMKLPLAQFTAEGGHNFKFLSDGSKTVFFSLGASVLAGYETINWDDKLLPDGATIQNSDAFIYGAALTLEWETYLTDWAVLLINVRERGLLGSSVGKFNTQLGLGIKFIIN
ncbi:Conjugative transposon protein TraO [Bacteroidales bacterium Barb7]|nr:Conjugative transposon protein TraO [Bacteroidales bacterium Barb7]